MASRSASPFLLACVAALALATPAAAKLNLVASLPDVADVAAQIGGDRVSVATIAEGTQDPHKVPVKPSFVTRLNRADALAAAVHEVCHDLAQQLLSDAEGAEHDIAVTVLGAASEDDAVEVGRAVARSNLFKAAIFGRDPNWGRILASIGTTAAAFDPSDLDIALNDVWVCRHSLPVEPPDKVDLTPRAVDVTIDLKSGPHQATVWTNDLTHAYVHENSGYST